MASAGLSRAALRRLWSSLSLSAARRVDRIESRLDQRPQRLEQIDRHVVPVDPGPAQALFRLENPGLTEAGAGPHETGDVVATFTGHDVIRVGCRLDVVQGQPCFLKDLPTRTRFDALAEIQVSAR